MLEKDKKKETFLKSLLNYLVIQLSISDFHFFAS